MIELEPYLGALLTVPVALGDSAVAFLFDTGGGGTLLTPEAAADAGCDPFGRVTGFRHDGEAVHFRRCPAAPLVIDGWRAPAREAGVFDLMALLPDGVPPLAGLVALNTFEGRAITLDLGAGRVVVESPGSLRGRVVSMREVPFRAGRQAGGAALDPFLSFLASGGPVWFELDSGNAGPVLIASHAAAQLGLDLAPDEPRPVTLQLAGYGPVHVQAQEKEMIYDGLLNAAFLRGLRVTLDLEAGRAWVGPAGLPPDSGPTARPSGR
ncbi:MAG: hypothetical protein GWN71_11925 [Gammaproteobacteria bacterium]|nr:hypothetical protein [Gemmatimonadota bacterium]NIU74262.1 hypothetical protein [Gammaproteobacteria bacterium]NIY08499.1 hypothetical protein [Gemmatimonadota bacterium]